MIHVGDFEIVLLDLNQVNDLQTALRRSRDRLVPIVDLLLDRDGTGLHPEIDERLHSTCSRLAILTWAELTPGWRGFGLGVLLAGLAMKHLSTGARGTICYPMPHLDQVRTDEIDETIAVACMMEV